MSNSSNKTLLSTLKITNERGLHARASAKFVKTAEKFDAIIKVTRNDITANGTSIMGLMMLGAAKGTEIHLSFKGVDSKAAQKAMETLINNKFDED